MPAVPVALAMGGGVVAGRLLFPVVPWAWIAIAGVALLVGVACYRRAWPSSLLILLAIVFVASARTQLVAYRFADDHVSHYANDDRRLCRLRAFLPHEPRIRTSFFGGRARDRVSTIATVTHLLAVDGWREASGEVMLTVNERVENLHAGQTVEVVGFIERPGIAMNPGQFDWQRYYRAMGVLNSVYVPRQANVTILHDGPAPWYTRWREYVRDHFDRGFTEAQSLDHKLLSALLLGDYDPELRDIKDEFRKTGTSHHLAISGMHIAVVGGVVFLIVRLCGFGPRACWMAGLSVVLLYGVAATPSPPVLRAVILFGVTAIAFILARFSGAMQILCLTLVVMLAWQPLDLFNAGFQLSFGTVLGLVLLSEPLAKKWSREEDEPILLPEEIERLPIGHKLKRWADRGTLRVLAAGVVAWLVSMPLIAAQFEQLNPWQVVASIVLAPLVTFSLLAGMLKIVGTALVPGVDGWLASLAAMSSRWMQGFVKWLATWPYGDVPLAPPPAWLVGMCWVALGVVVVRWKMTTVRLAAIALLVGTFGYMILGPYWFGTPSTLHAGQTRITLMAVGAGQCALVETDGGRVAMLDCGSASLTDLTGNVVKPLLRTRGITGIDQMLISHANTDHYSHVAEVASAYGAHEVMTAEGFERDARLTPSGGALVRNLNAANLPPRTVGLGDRVPISSTVWLEVLGPLPGMKESNDRSLIVRLHAGDRSILFTGDVQAGGMRALLDAGANLEADVLIAPHHGSSEDVTPAFVDAVAPEWVLSSNDRNLTGKQKRFDEMMRDRRLMRTNEHGAITILIERDGSMAVEGFVTRASGN